LDKEPWLFARKRSRIRSKTSYKQVGPAIAVGIESEYTGWPLHAHIAEHRIGGFNQNAAGVS
jgi:hypothetical protein